MKGVIQLIGIIAFCSVLWGCGDSGTTAASTTSTSSLQLPQQLEVVTNEND
ncbi:hypothetical protein L4D06_12885 [Enterovibrio makurazakiensis]|uniref:hypothetical protein n=1 Tax=Enterovibrio makurazakiensis TaxID=2910232 RepID=UPI003D231190